MLYVLRTKLSVVCKAGLSIKKICIKFIFFKLNIMFYFYKKNWLQSLLAIVPITLLYI